MTNNIKCDYEWIESEIIEFNNISDKIDTNDSAEFVKCVIYGPDLKKNLNKQIKRSDFVSQIKHLDTRDIYTHRYLIDSKIHIIKDIHFNVLSGQITHMDFYRLGTRRIKHNIHIKLKNESLCEDFKGPNIFNIKSHLVDIYIKPHDIIPSSIVIDVQPMYKNAVIFPSSLVNNSYEFVSQEHLLSLIKR